VKISNPAEKMYKSYKDVDKCVVDAVKLEILSKFSSTKDYNSKDVDLLVDNDWLITRHVMVCNRRVIWSKLVNSVVKKVDHCLRVRHELNLPEFKHTDFPREFYELRIFEIGFDDVTQRTVVHIRLGNYVDIPEFSEHVVKFLIYCASEGFNMMTPFNQLVCVYDATNFEVEDVNSKTIYNFMSSLNAVGQFMSEKVYIYNVGQTFERAVNFYINNFNKYRRDTITMVKPGEEIEKVPQNQWPVTIGGQLETEPLIPPGLNLEDCISLEKFAELNSIPEKTFEKAARTLRNLVKSMSIRRTHAEN